MGALAATTSFVGRARELAALTDALDAARDGRPGTVLVCGDAGLGKSRLVAEFARQARADGARVLVGGCLPMGGALPFTPVVEALRQLVDETGVDALRRTAGELGRDLRRLLPALGAAPTDDHDPGASRTRLVEAVLTLLGRLGRDRPHVLVLEDVHWIDPSTRDLLLFLAHNLRSAPVLLVATLRATEVHGDHLLRPVLDRVVRLPEGQRLDLSPLGRDEVAVLLEALLAAPPTREQVDQVVARAQGNPFFVEQLADVGARPGMLSATLRDVLLASVEVLPDETRRVLRLVAAAGRPVPHELLCRADGIDDEALEAALRPAVRRRVVVADVDAGTYALRHDLLVEAVASTLLPGERRRLHRGLAEALEADPGLAGDTPAGELAHHWHLAGDPVRALAASPGAAREAERVHATGEALAHVERMAELWDRVPDPEAVTGVDLAERLGWEAALAHDTGEVRRSVTLMERALAALPPDADVLRRASCWERHARYVSSADGFVAGRASVERAVALVRDEPASRVRTRVMLLDAHARWEEDPAAALAICEPALAEALRSGDREGEGVARTLVASCLSSLGRRDEAAEHFRSALAIAEEHGNGEDVARCHNMLSACLIRGGRADEGTEVALAGLHRSRALGVERIWNPMLAGNATSGMYWAGRWEEAERLVTELAGEGNGAGWLLLLQARLLANRGAVEQARTVLVRSQEFAGQPDQRYPAIAMQVELHAGDPTAAVALVRRRAELPSGLHAATVNERVAWSLRAIAAARDATEDADERAALEALADELLAEAATPGRQRMAHAEPWRRVALAEHARLRDVAASVTAWREAVAAWELLGWVPPLLWARTRLAEALLATSDPANDEAASLLRAVHEVATGIGAEPVLADVARLARRAGARGLGRRTAPDADRPHGLTPREQQVLELVVAGATNPEVGRALHISEKTASVHVSNILRKLEVGSRTEAAAIAVREGLVPAV